MDFIKPETMQSVAFNATFEVSSLTFVASLSSFQTGKILLCNGLSYLQSLLRVAAKQISHCKLIQHLNNTV